MVIISHRWSHHANHWYADPTQPGLLTGITLSIKHTQLRILGSYWPVPHAANQHLLSLHAHVVQYLLQHSPLSDFPEQEQHHPLTYIQDLIMRETHKHQRTPGNQTILLGDLNSSWLDSDKGDTHPALHRWVNQMGWCNPQQNNHRPTNYNQPKYAPNRPPSHPSPGLITSSLSRAPPCLNSLICT